MSNQDIRDLEEKLKKIEALFARAGSSGERDAAGSAIERIRAKMRQTEQFDPPIEYRFSLNNTWSKRLFLALLRRYDIQPYRRYRQRHTTVLAKVSERFVEQTLWPEFTELDNVLTGYLDEVAERVIREAIHSDTSDAEEIKPLR